MYIQNKLTPLWIVIISMVVIFFNITNPLTVFAETGLDFPGSGSGTVRFKFANPHLNGLPIYGPGGQGVTYIWKYYPRQQAGYYTTFFWGNDGAFWWDSGAPNTYYGFHPYPQPPPNGTVHKWEVSVRAGDYLSSSNVTYDQWYTQGARVWSDGSGKHHIFYWNLPNTGASNIVSYTAPTSYAGKNPPSPALTWGDAPWAPGNEVCDGIIRAIAIYNTALSVNDMLAEANSPLSTSAGNASIWYMNLNPTPNDISDKSGKGHHPVWVGSKRPALYSVGGSSGPVPPTNLHIVD